MLNANDKENLVKSSQTANLLVQDLLDLVKSANPLLAEIVIERKSAQFAMADDTPGNCNPYGKWIRVMEETPVDCPYPETYLDAVSKNGALLEYVPPEEQTAAVALAAVSQRPDALLWVLDQTDEVCKKAIAGRASAVQWIRDEGQKSRLEKKNTPTM